MAKSKRVKADDVTRIVVEVHGGMVSAVYLRDVPRNVKTEVIVYDHDNIEIGDKPPRGAKKYMKDKYQVY